MAETKSVLLKDERKFSLMTMMQKKKITGYQERQATVRANLLSKRQQTDYSTQEEGLD